MPGLVGQFLSLHRFNNQRNLILLFRTSLLVLETHFQIQISWYWIHSYPLYELGAFYYMHFTIPIVKCSFFNIFFHTFLNEHFTEAGKK